MTPMFERKPPAALDDQLPTKVERIITARPCGPGKQATLTAPIR
jgi:hypothetical protein